ncbi:hypothetical protein V9K67_14300 [Paraflavisolibacter sp. H34]|uniref:HYC_CC_PP family protein n=1 Tax=Huijunlia imazamoxiresistens TaxID=3127457 RepID=UPI003017AED9
MKRFLVILLLMVYGLSSTGATVHLHYCCGKLDKIEFAAPKEKKCGKHAKPMKNCCDDQQLDLKVKADQKVAHMAAFEAKTFAAEKPSYPGFALTRPSEGKHLVPTTFAPPPLPPYPLFILNCVYRI